eukprot:m.17479 g.17479  ORF g.17479 m.17479 type:complete len:899 (+) comp27508_c0_seq2:300-2996(+)
MSEAIRSIFIYAIFFLVQVAFLKVETAETVPEIITPPTSHIVYKDVSDVQPAILTLPCEAKGDEAANREWTRTFGGTIPQQNIQPNGSLLVEILDIRVNKYQCFAHNGIGKVASKSGVLSYARFEIDDWVQPKGTVVGYEGNAVMIPCTVPADTLPKPKFLWFENGKEIDTSSDLYTVVDSGNLYIRAVTTAMDQNEYSCRITNYHIYYELNSTTNAILEVKPKHLATAFKFTVNPRNVTATVGDRAVFEASAITNSTDALLLFWAHRGASAGTALGGSNILIEKVKETDAGEYEPKAVYGAIAKVGITAFLTVLVPPIIDLFPATDVIKSYIAYTGNPFNLTCSSYGNPPPTVEWFRNAESLQKNDLLGDYKVTEAAAATHAGMYQCFATNDVGEDHKTTRVIVRDAKIPNVTISPETLSVPDPGSALFTCLSYADPAADIIWSIDGNNNLQQFDTIVDTKITEQSSTLQYIFNASSLAGKHEVSCMAINIAGNSSTTASLFIEGGVFITDMPNPQTIFHGQTNVVKCNYTAYPPPNVTWTRNNKSLDFDYTLTDAALNITTVDFDNEGVYCCNLTNTFNDSIFSDGQCANVTVEAYPKLLGEENTTTSAAVNGPVELKCTGFGWPAPTIRWEREKEDSLPVTSTITTNLTDGNTTRDSYLSIPKFAEADAGVYLCIISNKLGSFQSLFYLNSSNETYMPTVVTLVPRANYESFPLIAVLIPILVLVLLVAVVIIVHYCKKNGSYEPTSREEVNIKAFHVRTEQRDDGELYAEAGPDIIQQRRKFLQEQAAPSSPTNENPNGTYATINSKKGFVPQSPDRPAPPYPGKAAPPYPGQVGPPGMSSPNSLLPPYPGGASLARVSSASSYGKESLDSAVKPPIDSPLQKNGSEVNGSSFV